MTDSAKSLCREVFRLELKAGDKSDELAENYTADEIHDAMEEVVTDLLSKVKSRDRKEKIFLLTYRIGLATNNIAMAEFGAEHLAEMGYDMGVDGDE